MEKRRKTYHVFFVVSLLGLILFGSIISYGKDKKDSKVYIPEGVYINLTKEFYEALTETGHKGRKLYSNDPETAYLKQIAISSRFMVETNLQILKQQESIIKLLHSVLEPKRK